MAQKTIILVDGENLVFRFKSLCDQGRNPRDDVLCREDTYVWHPSITSNWLFGILRVSYYTTYVGDDPAVDQLCIELSNISYLYILGGGIIGNGTINPHVFKKNKKSTKTKSVDINLTIDALRHAHKHDVERIILCSGDGDYLPLVKEIMRYGVIASVAAFSDGCHPSMKHVPDDFIDLDEIFFE